MLLSLENISKSFSQNLILNQINLNINAGDRIGLIGSNGAGKTTLLNIICGELEADSGEVSKSGGTTVGYLKQGGGLRAENDIISEMKSVFSKLYEAKSRMEHIAAEMSDIYVSEKKMLEEEYSELSAYFESNGGYDIEYKINTVLNGMGFSGNEKNKHISMLSGGEKTRLALAKLLLSAPDLLILDEPTNHLDFKTLMWLEDYLANYKGAILTVSHDRYFLDKSVNVIWELFQADIEVYKGNYTKYKQLKAERDARRLKEYEKYCETKAKMTEFAQRNIVRASTSARAKSRLKAIERLEEVKKPLPPAKPPKLSFAYDMEPVKEIVKINIPKLTVGNGLTLCRNISFTLRRGEKIAVIGDNGAGKTTLLKRIVKSYPDGDGEIKWGKNVNISYFDQEAANLSREKTVLEELWRRHTSSPEKEIRSMLGRVGITGDDVYKHVGDLSGGERARLAFAVMMYDRKNTLLFDEPTNHLDLPGKEAVEEAVVKFSGSVIFVSHDRYFLNSAADKIIYLSSDGIEIFDGGFDSYLKNIRSSKEEKKTFSEKSEKKEKTVNNSGGYKSKAQRAEQAKRRENIGRLEKLIAAHEKRISELESQLADENVQSDYEKLEELCAELEHVKNELDKSMEEWLCVTDNQE